MANRVDTEQTVPQEQSDHDLHCLLRPIGPNISNYYQQVFFPRGFRCLGTPANVQIGTTFVTFCFVFPGRKRQLFQKMVYSKKKRTSYYSYARPAQPGPNRTRLCGPCIAAVADD